jgi:O-antigen/teichoic acid export membrane protein
LKRWAPPRGETKTINERMTSRRLITNAVCNTLGFVAQVVVAFALAPVVLRELGDDRYGVWSAAESVLAYLMLFDLGVASALVRFVPRLLVGHDQAGVNRVFSACLAFFTAAATAAALVGGIGLTVLADRLIIVPPELHGEVRLVLIVVVLNFAAVLPLSVFPAMLDALNAFSAKTLTRTTALVIRIPATLWVIRGPSPLLGLILLLSASNLIESVALAALVFRRLPALRFVPRQVDRATVRMIRGYSLNSFVAMIAGRLSFSTDAFVIGATLGSAAITPFSFANRLVDQARAVLRSATMTLTPAISASDAAGNVAAVRGYFLHGTRLVLYCALPIQAGLLVLGPSFLVVWLRDKPVVARAAGSPLLVLAATLSFTIAQSVAARVLYGTGRIQQFARMALVEGVANLLLSLALVGPLGIVGVAWGTAIPHVGFCLFTVIYASRLIGVRPGDYVRTWAAPLTLTLLPTTVGLLRLWTVPLVSYYDLAVTGLMGGVPYLAVVAVLECRPWLAAVVRRLRPAAWRHSAPR